MSWLLDDSTVGVDGFVDGLAQCGVTSTVDRGVVTFTVEAPAGPLHGQHVPTGVGLDELGGWPLTPPHWVHLPGTVGFAHTNAAGGGALPGWLRHSRQIQNWGDVTEPVQAWLAHVRSVLATATTS